MASKRSLPGKGRKQSEKLAKKVSAKASGEDSAAVAKGSKASRKPSAPRGRPPKAEKSAKASLKRNRRDEDVDDELTGFAADGLDDSDEIEVSSDEEADAAEREASSLDLEEVAKQADLQENRASADADGDEGEGEDGPTEEQLAALAGVVPPSRPTASNSDEYDPESADAMAAFKGRSVLGREERDAVVQEIRQVAEKNGGYVTYEQLNTIVPQTAQDESAVDEYLMILQALNIDVVRMDEIGRAHV